jgi:ankyrin repeat protein
MISTSYCIDLLIDINALNDNNDNILHFLCKDQKTFGNISSNNLKNNYNIIKLLLSRLDLNINMQDKDNNTVLHILCNYKPLNSTFSKIDNTEKNISYNIVKLLLNRSDININILNNNNDYPIDIAYKNNNYEIFNILLKKNIDISIKNKYLYLTCKYSNFSIAKILLNDENIDVNYKKINEDNNSLLHLLLLRTKSCSFDYMECIMLLINHNNFNINCINNDNYTPLHLMCDTNENESNIYLIKLLLNNKNINVNFQCDNNKNTALHFACIKNNIEVVETLLKHTDIDIYIKNMYGLLPYDIACGNNNSDIKKLLTSYKNKKQKI